MTDGSICFDSNISIHALLAESDQYCCPYLSSLTRFLSTLSLRRATAAGHGNGRIKHISIHALLAESDFKTSHTFNGLVGISIHALLAESDVCAHLLKSWILSFLSTLSLRRATGRISRPSLDFGISIHALLAESDRGKHPGPCVYGDFYPRSPCGERPSWASQGPLVG